MTALDVIGTLAGFGTIIIGTLELKMFGRIKEDSGPGPPLTRKSRTFILEIILGDF